MPDLPHSNPKQLVQGSPVLHVVDVLATASYYRVKLGFHSDFAGDNYAVVWRDNAAVHFSRGSEAPSGVHLFVWVQDVVAYYEELNERGTKAEIAPTTQPCGIREFSILDINCVSIVFGQDDELI